MFPVYLPFLIQDKVDQIRNDMVFDKATSMYMRIGEMAGGICMANKASVCKKCIEEDYKKYKESYLHRMHQLPGNYFCNIHGELLEQVVGVNEEELLRIDINDANIHYKKLSFDQSLTLEL